jgi:hypothetical protein
MAETTIDSALLTRDLPLVRVKMTYQGPHVIADDEQADDGREESQLFTRAAVADSPNKDILSISTGVPILPTQSAQIAWYCRIPDRPQTWIYKIARFVISNEGTAGGAADWIVNDIKINDVSQFVQPGDVSGSVFATNEIDRFVRFEPVQITRHAVAVMVTYIGRVEMGCHFFGAMVGTVVDTAGAEISRVALA